MLTRFILRRDRIMILLWLIVLDAYMYCPWHHSFSSNFGSIPSQNQGFRLRFAAGTSGESHRRPVIVDAAWVSF